MNALISGIIAVVLSVTISQRIPLQKFQQIYRQASEYKNVLKKKCNSVVRGYSANYFKSIENSFGRIIMSADTIVSVDKFSDNRGKGERVPIAYIYRYILPDKISLQVDMGQIMLIVNENPVEFTQVKHCWRCFSLLTEFRSDYDKNVGRWRIIRDICLDNHGRFFIAIAITPVDKIARKNIKSKHVKLIHTNFFRKNDDYVILLKDMTSKLQQPTTNDFLTSVISKSITFVIGGLNIPNYKRLSGRGHIPRALTDMQKMILKRSPVNSIISAYQRRAKKYAPQLDCPEPWLNKLWIAQIYAMFASLTIDDATQFTYIKETDSEIFLKLLSDARWFVNREILIGTILNRFAHFPKSRRIKKNNDDINSDFNKFVSSVREALKCCPNPDISELFAKYTNNKASRDNYPKKMNIIKNYCDFMHYCRSFYIDNDFDLICSLRINRKNNNIRINIPAGTINFVVTKLIGLKVRSDDILHIRPAKYISHWPYFIIDNLPYRGHNLTIIWQSYKHPVKYPNMEQGFNLYIDGKLAKHYTKPETIKYELE